MIKARVLFFGATADAVGTRELETELPKNTKAAEFFDEIIQRYPKLTEHSLLFAVNQEYAKDDLIIENGDELAIFTAVSGG